MNNTFLGAGSGFTITTGNENTFVGAFAGALNNSTGGQNTFVGNETGGNNASGSGNTLLGYRSNVGENNLTFASAIGAGSIVNTSNTVVLGRSVDAVQVPGRLSVAGGSIVIGSPGQGIILKSPDGTTCRILTIDNTGALIASAIACS